VLFGKEKHNYLPNSINANVMTNIWAQLRELKRVAAVRHDCSFFSMIAKFTRKN
jgi:hypothetical protein